MQEQTFELSDQFIASVMVCLQWALETQQDLVPVFQGFKLAIDEQGKLFVKDAPKLEPIQEQEMSEEEVNSAVDDLLSW